MVRDVLRARASAEIGAHERAEDLKRSMIENMPPKGTIFDGFYSYICHIMFRVNRKFVFFMATLRRVNFLTRQNSV